VVVTKWRFVFADHAYWYGEYYMRNFVLGLTQSTGTGKKDKLEMPKIKNSAGLLETIKFENVVHEGAKVRFCK
jgi:hypothetical protein